MPRIASTTTPLAGGGEWSSGVLQPDLADRITGLVFSDQNGTLYIEQSANGGTNWDVSTEYAITGGDGKGFSEEILVPYLRIRYVNGATPQTAFRLSARMTAAGSR